MIIAIVPLRKGSKGIPGKNIKILGNKPLFCWVMDTIAKIKGIDETWIATDSEEIEKIAKERYGDWISIYRRSDSSSSDKSKVIEVIKEFVDFRQLKNSDTLILVQATCPFTSKEDFYKLVDCINFQNADSYISCIRIKKFSWSNDGEPRDYSLDNKPLRQDYDGLLLETGAFYASKVGSIKDSGSLLSGYIKIIETGKGTCIDIDEKEDWKKAEYYLTENFN